MRYRRGIKEKSVAGIGKYLKRHKELRTARMPLPKEEIFLSNRERFEKMTDEEKINELFRRFQKLTPEQRERIEKYIAPEVSPCPFCGGKSLDGLLHGEWCVVCTKCRALGSPCPTRLSCIESWNTRNNQNSESSQYVSLALELSKVAHKYHPTISHDIGLRLAEIVESQVVRRDEEEEYNNRFEAIASLNQQAAKAIPPGYDPLKNTKMKIQLPISKDGN